MTSSPEYRIAEHAEGRQTYQRVGLVLGPALAALLFVLPAPDALTPEAWSVVAVAAWMATWWATEAIPVPATSLLPLVLLPLLGVMGVREAAAPYASPVIFLLLGGFIIAMGIQRWNLHRRIALHILLAFGRHPSALVGGFMLAAALLSMWVSNTATTLMLLPIALSVAEQVLGKGSTRHPFTICLILGVAYAASIGGLGTIIGTPPNAFVVQLVADTQGIDISFLEWMAFGIPIVALMLPMTWYVLTHWVFRFAPEDVVGGDAVVRRELEAMGPITTPEIRTAAVFAVAAVSWMSLLLLRKIPGLEALSNMGIAVMGAVAMFLVPSGSKSEPGSFLLDWDAAVKLPWGVVLLFGGGLSLAAAIQATGLAVWLGDSLSVLTTFHMVIIIGALVALIIFLTELTSNTATVAAIVPVLAAIAGAADFAPILLAAPAAMAGSSAFMLPVATAPNAIVFATGHVTIPQMVKAGFRLNLIGIAVITLVCFTLVPRIFG
ncbi:MAG: DASS family sodium-coupled anion symporter [Sphingomonadales bacterium]|nr:DASS family sodium-coupled anion symporter [Sphingomonadales bacterium]